MELILALPAGHAMPAVHGPIPAHMAYRIGPGPVLLGISLPEDHKGGLMLLDCPDFDGKGDPLPCCSQIMGECRRREYRGIICDFEAPPVGCMGTLLGTLDRLCAKESWTLYVPEALAALAPGAKVLIPSPVRTGTLERRLRLAIDRFGPGRPVLAVEWLREDSVLPSAGQGSPLTRAALEQLLHTLEPAVFFDRGLCAHYFTYMAPDGQAHFVLFDSPRSLKAKILLAGELGLPAVLMAAPEVETHLGEIVG